MWQIAYAPYVSDYSRYLPKATGAKPAFWMSYLKNTTGSILPMLLGAGVGLSALDDDPAIALTKNIAGIIVLVVAVFSVGVAATNAMNLYCRDVVHDHHPPDLLPEIDREGTYAGGDDGARGPGR